MAFRVLNSVTNPLITVKTDLSYTRYCLWNTRVDSNNKYVATSLLEDIRFDSREDMILFFLHQDVTSIIKDSNVVWSKDDVAATKLQRQWRLHRNRHKKFFAVQAIAEYFGHPRFQNFQLEQQVY
jgi:hypothetical protein